MKKIMIFGVFDGIHAGHQALIKQTKELGDHLITVVTPDCVVESLKGHLPKINLAERLVHLQKESGVDEVIIGDNKLGSWEIIKKHKPDIIALGYDQRLLKEDLEKHLSEFGYQPIIKVLDAYEPDVYHSSKLNN